MNVKTQEVLLAIVYVVAFLILSLSEANLFMWIGTALLLFSISVYIRNKR